MPQHRATSFSLLTFVASLAIACGAPQRTHVVVAGPSAPIAPAPPSYVLSCTTPANDGSTHCCQSTPSTPGCFDHASRGAPRLLACGHDGNGNIQCCDGAPDEPAHCWPAPEIRTTGFLERTLSPQPVTGVDHVTDLALSAESTYVRRSDRSVWCWGTNDNLESGLDRAFALVAIPARVPQLFDVERLAPGCAIMGQDREVRCWGPYALPLPTRNYGMGARDFVPIAGMAGATAIAVGEWGTCAADREGRVSCWGERADFRGPHGGLIVRDFESPTPVRNLSGAVELAVGRRHACARLSDGTVRCWGENFSGALGNGSTIDSDEPVRPEGLADVLQIAASTNATCALVRSGSVSCWGARDAGGSGADVPTRVSGLADVTQISMSGLGSHACARRRDGAVFCWGENREGQLGDGTTTSSETPRRVPLPGDVVRVACGWAHTCALRDDGTILCWGSNRAGESGALPVSPRRR